MVRFITDVTTLTTNYCLSYFSVAVKKEFIWAYSSRGLSVYYGGEVWWEAAGMEAGAGS